MLLVCKEGDRYHVGATQPLVRILDGNGCHGAVGLFGCNRATDDAGQNVQNPAAQTTPKADNAGKPIEGQLVSRKTSDSSKFVNSVSFDPPNEDELGPPDLTCTGKSTAKIFEAIQNQLWDKVVFTNEAGKRIRYHAVLATDLGEIHADLLGDIAPNHVCNFVCLARSGYFDDMKFYYSLNSKVEDNFVAYIETGCPRGTGESGSGSIGYWLKPEYSDKVSHEEGVLAPA